MYTPLTSMSTLVITALKPHIYQNYYSMLQNKYTGGNNRTRTNGKDIDSGGTKYFNKVGSQTWLGHFYAHDLF